MNRKRSLALTALTVVIAGVSLLAGCPAANTVRIMPAVGMPAYSPTEPATVMVLRAEPLRPFEILGHIILEPEDVLPVPELEQKLRQAAASMGANAVVITADMSMKVGSHRSEAAGGQVVDAVAIRFKD
jgi:hypothetical protein